MNRILSIAAIAATVVASANAQRLTQIDPITLGINSGTIQSGSLASIVDNNNKTFLTMQRAKLLSETTIQMQLLGRRISTSNQITATVGYFNIQSSFVTGPWFGGQIVQRIDFFNTITHVWDVANVRLMSPFDIQTVVQFNPSVYIDAFSGHISARVTFIPGPTLNNIPVDIRVNKSWWMFVSP